VGQRLGNKYSLRSAGRKRTIGVSGPLGKVMANALFNDYWRVAWLQHEAHDLFLGHASYHSFITLSFLVSPGGASAGRASHSTVEGQRCGFMEVNVISSGHCRAATFDIGMVPHSRCRISLRHYDGIRCRPAHRRTLSHRNGAQGHAVAVAAMAERSTSAEWAGKRAEPMAE